MFLSGFDFKGKGKLVVGMKSKFGKIYIDYLYDHVLEDVKKNIDVNIKEMPVIKEKVENEIFVKCFKSLVYCMNLARVEEKLIGESPEDRYTFFCENEDAIIGGMEKIFPEMKNQISEEIRGKICYLIKVVDDFVNNYQEISKKFLLENEQIKNINVGGDWHNDKSVIIFEFTKGSKIVFKPTHGRNIEFLKGLSTIFFGREYSSLYDSLTTDEGTWVKFIEHKAIKSEAEIKEFYYNYGKLLYMTYILGINDMHYENLLANGVYPVITDVETIFSSYLFFNIHKLEYDAQYNATKKLLYGTMATGLVPVFTMSEYFGGDVSCLSNRGLKIMVEKLENEYRDDMCIKVAEDMVKSDSHLPNNDIDPLDYGKDILQGFNEADEIFRNNKQKIYKYINDNFDKVESRIILNMTKAYSKILRIKNDVKYRMNPELFKELLEKLKRTNQFNKKVYEHEIAELMNGNIPSFYWSAKEKCVYGPVDSSVEKIMDIKGFDIEDVKDIIEYQTADNIIEEQKNLIENAIISSKVLSINYIEKGGKDKSIKAKPATEKMLRENIDKNIILGKDNTIAWLGLMVNDQEQLEYAMVDWSLYSGISGIGLMYYTEWLNTGDRNAIAVMQLIVNTIKKEYDLGRFDTYDISYFCGLTGIYSFIKKVEKIPGIELFGLKESFEELIEKNIEYTNCYDSLSGVHSAVLYYYSDYKENYFSRKIITAITYHFMENFNMRMMDASFSFASFAHGYTGLMTSLLCMNRVVKDDRFSILIKKAWEKEKNLKVSDFKWVDKRRADGSSSHYWCHGSCGIMHARLFWYKEEFLKDIDIDYTEEQMLSDLRGYKEIIEASEINTNNYSLCHGNFALIDYLISFERLTGERMNKKYTDLIFDKAREDGYSCIGAPGAINAIGYMVGETGIRYLLNRYENRHIKSILTCENL